MLSHLQGNQYNGAFSGGSFATPDVQGNTVMKMFAPGSEIQPPTTPILDPFTNRLHTRFEVPDTSKRVNLGEIVMFTTLTNKENFMTRDIYPIRDWGWAVRTFEWSIWNFPQHPVRPTPETAPPRFLASSRLSETTSLMRFSIGQHMSNEYGKTTMGKANQSYNLEQMELSVQERLNLMAINELKRCQYKHRNLIERLGEYTVVDIENAMKKEVSQFCRPQKAERGFQTLWEEIATDMARAGGKANSAILTNRINSLILAKPEMTEYWRAGAQGPATVASPTRSFLPSGITVYYTRSYPERFGLDVDPWQHIIQIGNYYKSLELPILLESGKEYLENYTSKVRDLNIYNQESDAIHTIHVGTLITQSHIWRSDGNLTGATEPVLTNRGRGNGGFTSSDMEDNFKDFLSFDPQELSAFQPLPINESFNDELTRDQYRDNINSRLSLNANQYPKGLEVFGQLKPQHFGWQNIRDTGSMIMYRLASLIQMDPSVFSQRVTAALRLYNDMCKREPDLDFVNFAIKNHVRDLYRTLYNSLEKKPGHANNPKILSKVWVDSNIKSRSDLYERMGVAFLDKDTLLSVQKLKTVGGGSGHVPLPLGTSDDFPEVEGKVFRNLTGYASYAGFQSMGEAYRSGNALLTSRYNVEDLKIASEYVEIMEHIAAHLQTILPGCQCFEEVTNGKKTGGEVISEQFFNMVGIRVWANIRKAEQFIMDKPRYNVLLSVAPDGATYRGTPFADLLKINPGKNDKLLNARGELFEELVHAGLSRFYSGETMSGESLLTTLGNVVQAKARKLKDPTLFTKFMTEIEKGSNEFLKKANNYELTKSSDIVDLVKQWVAPTVARGIGIHDDADDAHANLNTDVRTVVIYHLNDHGAVIDELGGFLGISKIIEASAKVEWLSLSNPFSNEIFMPFFGPLRLQLYGLVIQAMILVCQHYDGKEFLEAFLKLNSLMIPFTTKVKVASNDCLDLSIATKVAGNVTHPTQRNKVFAAENKVVAERDKAYVYTGTKVEGVRNVARTFRMMLQEIFGKNREVQEEVEGMLEILDGATKEQDTFDTEVTNAATATGPLYLPFLKYLGRKGTEASVTVNTTLDAFPALVTALLFTKGTNHVATTLGLRVTDSEEDLGSATQSMIGGRVGRREKQGRGFRVDGYDDDGEEGIGFKVHESFVLTPLVLSADQIERLFAKNGPEMSKQIFDIRVGQPYDPSRYVPVDGQPDYLALIKRKNTEHIKGMHQRSGAYSGSISQISDWVDVPLRYINNRSKITFFGPKVEKNGRIDGLSNIAGLRMQAYYTTSFIRNCQDLDENCLNELEKAMALCWMSTPFTHQACQALQTRNIRIPMNFLVVRPHANYLMEMCAVLAPGVNDLGFTAIAGKDYTYGFTTLTKEMYGNLSFWAGIVTLHPENCRMIKNLMCVGYGTGGGVQWFDPTTYNPLKLGSYKTPQNGSESLMCMAIPFTENPIRDYIVTSGRLQHVDDGHGSSNSVIKTKGDDSPHYSTYMRYNLIWKWRDLKDSHLMETVGDNGQYPLYNKVCWSGFALYYDPKSREFKYATRNKGHWGENEGPGCQRIRQGAVEVFPDFKYATRYVIVA